MIPADAIAQNRIGLTRDRLSLIESRIVVESSSCWVWTGNLNHHGYGLVIIAGKRKRVHRVTWAMINGEPPSGSELLHSCDNPQCCNPNHVSPGTQAKNMHEMQARGRKPVGSNCSWSILNDETVAAIRQRKSAGESVRVLALEFAVSESAVYKTAQGTRWKHITVE